MIRLIIAIIVAIVIIRMGIIMLKGLAQPVPEPPPPGELRKVKLSYRCCICGAEARMTRAADEMPIAPRHCMEDMDLVRNALED